MSEGRGEGLQEIKELKEVASGATVKANIVAISGPTEKNATIIAANIIALGEVSPDATLKHSEDSDNKASDFKSTTCKAIQFENKYAIVNIDENSKHWIIRFDKDKQKFIMQHREYHESKFTNFHSSWYYELEHWGYSQITIQDNKVSGTSYKAKTDQPHHKVTAIVEEPNREPKNEPEKRILNDREYLLTITNTLPKDAEKNIQLYFFDKEKPNVSLAYMKFIAQCKTNKDVIIVRLVHVEKSGGKKIYTHIPLPSNYRCLSG